MPVYQAKWPKSRKRHECLFRKYTFKGYNLRFLGEIKKGRMPALMLN